MTEPRDREHHKTGRCAGECCRLIMLSADPESIARWAAKSRQSRTVGGDYANPDAEFVEARFIPVAPAWDDPINGGRWPDGNQPRMTYRCSVWDGITKRCTAYAERPRFCRSFGTPAGPTCLVEACTLTYEPVWRDLDTWANDGGAIHA